MTASRRAPSEGGRVILHRYLRHAAWTCFRSRPRSRSPIAAGRASDRRTRWWRSGTPSTLGVDAVECDVRLSRDGEVVVIHDATVDRTTNATGPVSRPTRRRTWRVVDAGWRFRDEQGQNLRSAAGIGVPRLADVLDEMPDVPFVIEIKGDNPAVVPPVLDVIARHAGGRAMVIGGFSDRVLSAVRAQAPGIATSASSAEVRSAVRRAWFRLVAPGHRVPAVPDAVPLRGRQILSRRLVRAVAGAAMPGAGLGGRRAADMRTLLEWGVTGLISDRPDRARAVIDGAPLAHRSGGPAPSATPAR